MKNVAFVKKAKSSLYSQWRPGHPQILEWEFHSSDITLVAYCFESEQPSRLRTNSRRLSTSCVRTADDYRLYTLSTQEATYKIIQCLSQWKYVGYFNERVSLSSSHRSGRHEHWIIVFCGAVKFDFLDVRTSEWRKTEVCCSWWYWRYPG